ncbi:MAG: hypothetical protein MZV64_49745 [Ignavibacteriales bacterium]|nr:hypothetical protein [Ignavibacteriales bacterium]
MAAVGRPARRLVADVVLGQLGDLVGPQVEDVDVEGVVDPGDEGDPLARRGPGRRVVVVAAEAGLADVGALGVHDVDLGAALAEPVGGEGDLAPRRRPGRGRLDGGVEGQPLDLLRLEVHDEDVGVALLGHGRAEGQLLAVGREGGRIARPLRGQGRLLALVDVAQEQAGVAAAVGGEGDRPLVRRPGRHVVLDLVERDARRVGPVVVHHVDLVVAVPVGDEADLGREQGLLAVELEQLVGHLVGDQAQAVLLGLVALADDEALALDVVDLAVEDDPAAVLPDLAGDEEPGLDGVPVLEVDLVRRHQAPDVVVVALGQELEDAGVGDVVRQGLADLLAAAVWAAAEPGRTMKSGRASGIMGMPSLIFRTTSCWAKAPEAAMKTRRAAILARCFIWRARRRE